MNDIVADDLVRVAHEDADACELMMSATPPMLGTAAYHAEQCAEKAVKAALTNLGIAYGWTHDVQGLAALIPATHPFSSPATQLSSTTPWAVAFRYSATTTMPSAGDIRASLIVARQLIDLVIAEFRNPSADLTMAMMKTTPREWTSQRMVGLWLDEATLAAALAAPSANDTAAIRALRAIADSIRQPEYDLAKSDLPPTGRILHEWDGAQHVLDMMRAGKGGEKARLYLNIVKLEAAIHAQSNLQPEFKQLLAAQQSASPARSPATTAISDTHQPEQADPAR